MAGSIDRVLQADGTYKWEVTELKPKTQEVAEVTSPPKETKKKVSKKKTTTPLSHKLHLIYLLHH